MRYSVIYRFERGQHVSFANVCSGDDVYEQPHARITISADYHTMSAI